MTEETMEILDRLWSRVDDAQYGTPQNKTHEGYNVAIQDVLGLIEDAGGKDPAERARENGQFGVGA